MARFAAGGRGGRGRGRRPHPGRGKPQAGPGAAIVDQEQSASYRPMGAALTIQEVSLQPVLPRCLQQIPTEDTLSKPCKVRQ